MKIFEKIKRKYLLYGLDGWIEIINFVNEFRWEANLSTIEIKNKTLELVKFLLESNDFIVGELDENGFFFNLNLSINESITKIKLELEKGLNADGLWAIIFGLTDEGIRKAKFYLEQLEKIKINILKYSIKQSISLQQIQKIIQKEFTTNDSEEIQYEAIDTLIYLLGHELITIELNENGKITCRNINYNDFIKQLRKNWINLVENVSFKITKKGISIIDKFLNFGGSIHDYSKDYDTND